MLHADDSRLDRTISRMMLYRHGVDFTVAGGAEEVSEVMDARRFDLIFLDLAMPNADGFGAARQLVHAVTTMVAV